MIDALLARLKQGHHTFPYPAREPALPDRYRGRPQLQSARCPADCGACLPECPTAAITRKDGSLQLDLGACLFCGECARACPHSAINFSNEFRLAARARSDLIVTSDTMGHAVAALDEKSRRLFGRSLRLRQVSAGGCNACEADTNVLGTLVFDLGRFGVQFVASPRHADGLLITGPVSQNMMLALQKTYEAVPDPKIVIAVGACAITGGIYAGHPEVLNGAEALLPIDVYVPGCPPHPMSILDGILRALGRIDGV